MSERIQPNQLDWSEFPHTYYVTPAILLERFLDVFMTLFMTVFMGFCSYMFLPPVSQSWQQGGYAALLIPLATIPCCLLFLYAFKTHLLRLFYFIFLYQQTRPYLAFGKKGLICAQKHALRYIPWDELDYAAQGATGLPDGFMMRHRVVFLKKNAENYGYYNRGYSASVKSHADVEHVLYALREYIKVKYPFIEVKRRPQVASCSAPMPMQEGEAQTGTAMERIKDWESVRKREALWEMFYPTPAGLNNFLLISIFSLPAILWGLWHYFTDSQSATTLYFVVSIALAGFFYGYNAWILKSKKNPSVAISPRFLALKRAYMPGYLLLHWSAIDKIAPDKKNLSQFLIYMKNLPLAAPLPSYFPLAPQDLEQIFTLAQERIPVEADSPLSASAAKPDMPQGVSLAPPQRGKSRVRPVFKGLAVVAGTMVALVIGLILYLAIDSAGNLPDRKELMTGSYDAPYQQFMRRYPEPNAETGKVIRKYTHIYEGWLIQRKCSSLSPSEARKLQQNIIKTQQVFRQYLASSQGVAADEALSRTETLHHMVTAHLPEYDCADKGHKLPYYSYFHSRKWARENKAFP